MSWDNVRIGDIACLLRNGKSIKQSPDAGGMPITRIETIASGSINLSKCGYADLQKEDCPGWLLEDGDILISHINSLAHLGKCAIFEEQTREVVHGMNLLNLRVSQSIAVPRYVLHALRSKRFRAQISRITKKSVNQASFNISTFKELEIPLPPLEEQQRIATILDRADQIYSKLSSSIKLEDELNSSVFNAIFGDTSTNPHGFPEIRLADLCERPDHIKCGPFGTQLKQHEFRESGVPLWGIKHVNHQFQLSTNEFLEEGTAHRLSTYSIQPGDIVMTRKGTIGNCSVYPENFSSGIMHSDLLRIRLDQTKCLPDFVAYQLHHSPAIKRQIQVISGGAVMAGINVGKLKEIKIIAPHIDIQKKFTSLLNGASQKTWAPKKIATKHSLDLIASLKSQVFSGMQSAEGR